ncbi:MAG: cation transporter [Paenibacillaceae bacterium]|jgi:cation diffusion facilitator family transporter|nr:cation transporter [Paenibacillaceae bacterium]
MSDQHRAKAEVAAWLGIVGNVGLAALKGVVGWLAGSKALLADAAHSASDVIGSLAVLIGLKAAQLPPDEDHPYGHGKAESISAIVVSILLILVGFEIGVSAIKAFIHGVTEPPRSYALIVITISIFAKEILFQYKYRLGKKLGSKALIANAWEHRSDVYSSLAAFAGVGGAVLGHWMGMPSLYYLDPAAGLFVSLLVLKMGYKLIMESIHDTMDHVLHHEEADELLKAVQRVPGVIAVDSLRAREHGHYVIVDVKISVNPRISVMEGHDIAKHVKHMLLTRFIHVSDVFIHVNPYDPGYPYKNNVDSEQDDFPSLLH